MISTKERIDAKEVIEQVQTKEVKEVVEAFPIPVATDYDQTLKNAHDACKCIDIHLGFETELQGREMSPIGLCDDQKQTLLADIEAE